MSATTQSYPSIETVFATQRKTAIALRTSTAQMRIEKLKRLEAAILSHRAAIFKALAADLHRSEAETEFLELLPVIAGIRHARRHLKSWMKPKRVPPTLMMLGTRARIVYEPRGVSLIIAPWNYPVSLLLGPLISAIAAGCPVIVKPSEISEACASVMTELIRDTFDPQDIAAFEGDVAVSTALLDLPFDHIFFTGSPAVGKVVMAAAAKHLASVTLELGGKSPVIVDESADIAKAAKSIAWGKFSNSGQTCIAPDYAFVHESRLPQFIEAMKDAIASMYGDAVQSPDYARIINARNFERVSRLIDDAVSGRRRHRHGRHTRCGAKIHRADAADRSGLRFSDPSRKRFSGRSCRSFPITIWRSHSPRSTRGQNPSRFISMPGTARASIASCRKPRRAAPASMPR